MTIDFRALCAELVDDLELCDWPYKLKETIRADIDRARAALADEPAAPEGREPAAVITELSDAELLRIAAKGIEPYEHCGIAVGEYEPETNCAVHVYGSELCTFARAVLARWGTPAPAPPADGEVAELVEWLQETGRLLSRRPDIQCRVELSLFTRAAELLQRQALVPEAASDALIKAECALSDIAEGEPMTDEGNLLQWAERRCADTLAIIRPTMRQHKIRTSEWPPVPASALPLPEVGE